MNDMKTISGLKLKRHRELIGYIMQHNRCDQQCAETWADKNLPNWRSAKAPKAKVRYVKINEKEWDDE